MITISPQFFKDVTLRRPTEPTAVVENEYVPAATADTTIKASMQPASHNTLLSLPEGERTRGPMDIITLDELRTADYTTKTEADIIIFNDIEYEIRDTAPWQYANLAHHEYVGLRRDKQ